MLITEKKFGTLKIVNIFFAENSVSYTIPDCDVVTYHTYEDWGDIKDFEKNTLLTTTIDLSQSIDVLWKNIHRQHKRHILRAEKAGTTVSVSDNFENFHKIYKKFLKQKNYADQSGLSIPTSNFMQKYGLLFIAENQGQILVGNLYFHDQENALLMNSPYQIFENNPEKKKLCTDASCFLQWKAMQFFKNLGVINYDFGGLMVDEIKIHHKMPGLNYYKLSFGGDVVPLYEYRKFNSSYNKLLFQSWNFLRSYM
jgi:hypothetical protein